MRTIQKLRAEGYQCAVFECSWGCCAWLQAELAVEATAPERVSLIEEPNLVVVYAQTQCGLAEEPFFQRGFLWARR